MEHPSDIPPLASFTTLRVGGPPRSYCEVASEDEIVDAVRSCDGELLILAGGSNLFVSDDGFDGTVIHIKSRGVTIEDERVTVSAGEPWDAVVAATVEMGLSGIELLSGIPGSTGATPIQNVGAYGQDVKEVITFVTAYDLTTGQIVEIPASECGFGYRTSRFKDRSHVVLSVTFDLDRSELSSPIRYTGLADRLGVDQGSQVLLSEAREAVLAVREEKGMLLTGSDPDSVSAGSFFKNPFVSTEQAAYLNDTFGIAPVEAPRPDGKVKISAASLILGAGFERGYAGQGGARLSSKHVLAIVNGGGATSADLIRLAQEIHSAVLTRFDIDLVPEPTLVGLTL